MQGLGEKGDIPNMDIKSVLIDGLRIYDDAEKSSEASYIQIRGPVRSMVVRDVEVLRSDAVPVGGALDFYRYRCDRWTPRDRKCADRATPADRFA